jgi:lipooligosaccharide transport system permease protein
MVTTMALPAVARRVERRFTNTVAVTRRNATAARHVAYWWVLVSGFFEPLLYLWSIGFGVGALIDGFQLADGRTVSYAAFVAPSMLAASSMNGALAEATFNFFGKLKYLKLYDAVLATPVGPMEIAVGELLWAMLRGAAYSAAFLTIMVWIDLTTPLRALAAFPATLAVGFSFGAVGMLLSTLVRGWYDFDYVMVAMFALFLFSGTFTPVSGLPPALRLLVEATPLYHGVEIVRSITTGTIGPAMLWHLGYLVVLTAFALALTARRMNRILRP